VLDTMTQVRHGHARHLPKSQDDHFNRLPPMRTARADQQPMAAEGSQENGNKDGPNGN